MTQLAAEIFLEMESQRLIHLIPQHLPGTLNFVPDQLSRPQTAELPAVLRNVPIRSMCQLVHELTTGPGQSAKAV